MSELRKIRNCSVKRNNQFEMWVRCRSMVVYCIYLNQIRLKYLQARINVPESVQFYLGILV